MGDGPLALCRANGIPSWTETALRSSIGKSNERTFDGPDAQRMKILILAAMTTMSMQAGRTVDPPYPSVLPYASVEGWNVLIDMESGPACYVLGTYGAGTIVRMGADASGSATLVVANARWRRLKDGSSYDAVIGFDDRTAWKGKALYAYQDGIGTMVFRFTDPRFVKLFMDAGTLTMRLGTIEMTRVALKGSARAMAAMARCQAEVESIGEAAEDGHVPQNPVGTA